jgi:hypothetical protein
MPENTVCLVDSAAERKVGQNGPDNVGIYSVESISLLAYDYILVTALGHEKEIISSLRERFSVAPEKIINLAVLECGDTEKL